MFYIININAGEIFFIVTQKKGIVNGGKRIFDEKVAILQLLVLVLAFYCGRTFGL